MIRAIKKLAAEKGYRIFEQPYKLNIWGIRSSNTIPNSFDDEIHVFLNIGTLKKRKWAYYVFKCTTDPGTYWLKNPMNPQGTAILSPGQYINAYSLGIHRGQYRALVQKGVVNIIRDYNRDAVLDFNNGKTLKGYYGINIHRASRIGSTLYVDKHSAGCQVFKNIEDFNYFIRLCELHKGVHGNQFTYTLIDHRMEYRQNLKSISIAGVFGGLLLTGFYINQTFDYE